MKRAAVFFDRDNTLIVNDDYLGDPDKVQLMTGAAQAVARVKQLGFLTVVASNQSGVGRGFYTEDQVRAVNQRMDDLLRFEDALATIDRHEYCPNHPQASVEQYRVECNRRKPGPGMLLDAARALNIDLKSSWMIGDAPRDIEAAHAAGCRAILLNEPGIPASPAASDEAKRTPEYIATSLADAVDFIEMHMEQQKLFGDPGKPSSRSSNDPTPSPASTPQPPPVPAPASLARTEQLLERLIEEVRRANEPSQEFSVPRMLAGVIIGFASAAFFAAVIFRNDPVTFTTLIGVAIFLQLVVTSLLLMGR